MKQLQSIKDRIQKLTPDELDQLRGWFENFLKELARLSGPKIEFESVPAIEPESKSQELKNVTLYTDGACLGNPGPGGYAAILIYNGHRREITGGYRWTTNNRMELMAAIAGLEAIKEPCQVTLFTDSQYLQKAMEQGWVDKWKARGWRTSTKQPAKNVDLWMRLTALCEKHKVKFKWVRGHAGQTENERCDELATEIAARKDLPEDIRSAD